MPNSKLPTKAFPRERFRRCWIRQDTCSCLEARPQGTASTERPPHTTLTNRTPDTAGRTWRLLAMSPRSQPACSRVEACSTVENPPAALDLPPPAVSRAPCSRFQIPAVIGGPRHPSTWVDRRLPTISARVSNLDIVSNRVSNHPGGA
jgi:hypothetical protein